jgi:hypothetical protein
MLERVVETAAAARARARCRVQRGANARRVLSPALTGTTIGFEPGRPFWAQTGPAHEPGTGNREIPRRGAG